MESHCKEVILVYIIPMYATLGFGWIFKCFDRARVGIEAAQLDWGYNFVQTIFFHFSRFLEASL